MLTEQEITRLEKIFHKRAELERSLEDCEGKEDHENDFNYLVAHMATKEDLADLENRIMNEMQNQFTTQFAIHLSPLVSRLNTSDEKQREQDEKFNRIMNSIDKLCEPVAMLQEENAMSAVQYQRQVGWNHKVAEKVGIPFDY